MCRHSELPQGSKMGTTRAGSAVSMEAEKLKINYISIWISPPQNICIYFSASRKKPTTEWSEC